MNYLGNIVLIVIQLSKNTMKKISEVKEKTHIP